MGRNERGSERYTHSLAQNDANVGPRLGTSVEWRTVGCLTGPAAEASRAEPRRLDGDGGRSTGWLVSIVNVP